MAKSYRPWDMLDAAFATLQGAVPEMLDCYERVKFLAGAAEGSKEEKERTKAYERYWSLYWASRDAWRTVDTPMFSLSLRAAKFKRALEIMRSEVPQNPTANHLRRGLNILDMVMKMKPKRSTDATGDDRAAGHGSPKAVSPSKKEDTK